MAQHRQSTQARLDDVHNRIERAAARANRDPASVALIAVSKKKSPSVVAEARALGCLDFGENYVAELREKAAVIDARWHFIGHLQRNKVGQLLAVPGLVLIHGVDSERLLKSLGSHAERDIDVLIQVNVSREGTKSGCAPEQLPALLALAEGLDRVTIRGLMTMPPAGDAEDARPVFAALRALCDQHGLAELSMGMSHDFEVAIEEGATIVRVGSAIFGAR